MGDFEDKFDNLLFLEGISLITEMAMVGQLEDMRRRGAANDAMQKILASLRDWIFKYSEAAKNILDLEKKDTKQAAGAMRLLEYRLLNSGISPDWFNDLNDKEYVSKTFRSIKENSERITSKLSGSEKEEVDNFITVTSRIDDYDYYINNHHLLVEYRNALPTSKGSGAGTRTLGIVIALFGIFSCCSIFAFSSILMPILTGAFNAIDGGNSSSGGVGTIMAGFGFIVCGGLPLALGSFLAYQGHQGATASKTIKKISGAVDLSELNKLDEEFNGDVQFVQTKKDEAQALFNSFFENRLLDMP